VIDQDALVADLRRQVAALDEDLRARSEELPDVATRLRTEYDEACNRERTAAPYETWRDERVTQVAVAWVLATVFVRFCEDNELIEWPFLAGPGERLADAEERHEQYFRAHPERNDRDWLIESFEHLSAAHPTAAGLFDHEHNPLWEIEPSFDAATALLRFWRRRGDDGEIVHDFRHPEWDTRFLGDLYQDLSEDARKRYALLQTPEFVEEFILDLTLEPAAEEFGLTGLRCIDPACGSGHFLLGIFHRLLARWRDAAPGVGDWELIRRALGSVHGADKNPFAASIARFRLLVAALRAAGVRRLDGAQEFPVRIAVGDSLIHGRGAPAIQGALWGEPHTYATEDVTEYARSCDLLGRGSYHVVVGNPPYVTVKDECERANYREYKSCYREYSLSVPFAELLFQLAIRRGGSERDAGLVGQITANSFMKREFGKKLIQDFFPTVHLTHVIDTSGAYIPGHGTPTVILAGRNHIGRTNDPIRAVLGVRGEPAQPEEPAKGHVWHAIVEQVGKPGSESEWVSVEDADRQCYAQHPWSLSGGGAAPVIAALEKNAIILDAKIVRPIGRAIRAGADEAYMRPMRFTFPTVAEPDALRPLMIGEAVRDWDASPEHRIWYPYAANLTVAKLKRELWAWRTLLAARRTFQGDMADAGLGWWQYMQHTPSAYATPLSIAFAEVATHNHFVLDRGGKVFKQTAPVIKLPARASEAEHLELLGVLNSSTACFWLKQVTQRKGGDNDQPWARTYQFNSTKVAELPLPAKLPLDLGSALDSLAQRLTEQEPEAVCAKETPTRERLDAARAEHKRIRGRMIAVQEELDWQVYGSYGFLSAGESVELAASTTDDLPEVDPAERAFAIVLARRWVLGEIDTSWFTERTHCFTPVTELPDHWPAWYRQLVAARIETIEARRDIALIEASECKRRWAAEPWAKREAEALRTWLADRCERRDLWYALRDGMTQPRTLTVSQLADAFRTDEDMQAVARLYAADHLEKRDLTLAEVLERIVANEHVPYLAALRYKDSGLRKRAQWERVWQQQRAEDRTGERLDIPVPPKYAQADFRQNSYWSQRGKLDVPKERFVSYPQASPDADPTLLLGWAGWDHAEQAQALVNVINDRSDDAGWGTEKLTPLLAGLGELMPWLWQWHGSYDEEWGGVPAEEYQAFLAEQRGRHHLTEQDLAAWRPVAGTRGRRKGARA
jgi:hypothetical protein